MSSKMIKWFKRKASIRKKPENNQERSLPLVKQLRLSFRRKKNNSKSFDSSSSPPESPSKMGAFYDGSGAEGVIGNNSHEDDRQTKLNQNNSLSGTASMDGVGGHLFSKTNEATSNEAPKASLDSPLHSSYENDPEATELFVSRSSLDAIGNISKANLNKSPSENSDVSFSCSKECSPTETMSEFSVPYNVNPVSEEKQQINSSEAIAKSILDGQPDEVLNVDDTFDKILRINNIEVESLVVKNSSVTETLDLDTGEIKINGCNVKISPFIETEIELGYSNNPDDTPASAFHDEGNVIECSDSSEAMLNNLSDEKSNGGDDTEIFSVTANDQDTSSGNCDGETDKKNLPNSNNKEECCTSESSSTAGDIDFFESDESSSHESPMKLHFRQGATSNVPKENKLNFVVGACNVTEDNFANLDDPTTFDNNADDRCIEVTSRCSGSHMTSEINSELDIQIVVTEPSPELEKQSIVFTPPIQTSSPTTPSVHQNQTANVDYPEELNPFDDDEDELQNVAGDNENSNPFGTDEDGSRWGSNQNERNSAGNRQAPSLPSFDKPLSLNPFGEYEDVEIERLSPTNPFAVGEIESAQPESRPKLPPKNDIPRRDPSLSSTPTPHPRKTKQRFHSSFSSLESMSNCPIPAPRTLTPASSQKTLNDSYTDVDDAFARCGYGRSSVQTVSVGAEKEEFVRNTIRRSVPADSRVSLGKKKRPAPLPPGNVSTSLVKSSAMEVHPNIPQVVPHKSRFLTTKESILFSLSRKGFGKSFGRETKLSSSSCKPPPRPPPPRKSPTGN